MPQNSNNYVGQRLSFNDSLCTVLYVGAVEGTEGVWLGVEWDDPLVGKHAGSHNGKEYFKCRSESPKAGSFIRPKRQSDKAASFLQALRNKYYEDDSSKYDVIQISASKVVEEVGFEKIRRAQAMLQELRIVLLTGQHLAGLLEQPFGPLVEHSAYEKAIEEVASMCPKVRELDLSRNLLENLWDIAAICKALPELKTLTLNGNRLWSYTLLSSESRLIEGAFDSLRELYLDGNLLAWDEVVQITKFLPSLHTLSLATNNISTISQPLATPTLHTLSLAHNNISNLSDLEPLAQLQTLKVLSVADNKLISLSSSPVFTNLDSLDLSSNALPTLTSLNPLNTSFPSLTTLRISRNPFFAELPIEDAHMLSLARLPRITILNFSDISPEERENAELYYLSKIAAELGTVREEDERSVLSKHPLWDDLCQKYGAPVVKRAQAGEAKPGTLGARLIRCKLQMERQGAKAVSHEIVIPKSVNVYVLKSLIGERLELLPADFKVVWETGEWDPVRTAKLGKDDDARFEVGEALDEDAQIDGSAGKGEVPQGRWMRREVELIEGTSSLGFWIEGTEATLRIERLES